ncbi:Subunit of both RNase MRP and nuclear RNase P [Komagataella phaffii GS115]|uniref:Subunit of both RNase MRP and nuclear RNase P n=2 Tax=Komagataella phaffii TaxID=460519 RepID=C4R8A2_KOMPG|nr:Subunit of both RNase MRP and nuclear RNase P [Komagataella phaffii GS115]AOA65057.1 GQ67_04936T0 [Komagataella phaffii]CAY71827.1 Subunit of both RNase MRP and nuclear RNase P [Komagataella phaffii GS115]
MLCDLNIPWPVASYNQRPTMLQVHSLKQILCTLEELGYSQVAFNFELIPPNKVPNDTKTPNPIDLSLFKEFKGRIKLYTRITLVIDDPSQCQGLSKLTRAFDIIAVRPRSERALQLAVSSLECDLITFNYGERLPCYLKHKTVCSAIEKGILFEIVYCAAVDGPAGSISTDNGITDAGISRKHFFNGVASLIRASRSRGLVISSGATNPLLCRNSYDVINLLTVLGLASSTSKQCVSSSPAKVLLNGTLRIRSYKQTAAIGDEPLAGGVGSASERGNSVSHFKRKLEDNTVLQRQKKKLSS